MLAAESLLDVLSSWIECAFAQMARRRIQMWRPFMLTSSGTEVVWWHSGSMQCRPHKKLTIVWWKRLSATYLFDVVALLFVVTSHVS